jgi:hypothetical protein
MKRKFILLVGFAMGTAAFACAQDQQMKPQVPEDIFSTRELIAWSNSQKPQPTPQPLPPPDKPVPQPDQQRDQSAQPNSNAPAQEASAKSFVGKIVKDSGKYVLKVATGTTYQLTSEGDVSRYEDKSVKVIGDLDGNNTIHVTSIELIS